MKAIIRDRYGPPDILELREIEKPVPKDDEMLVRVDATSVSPADWHGLRGTPFMARLVLGGLIRPKLKILGFDVAGQVEAVGTTVKAFQPGDEVFGTIKGGGFAEYLCMRDDLVVMKPTNVSFENAASVPTSAIAALQSLRDHGQIQSGQSVLINGASGGIGTFAVQIAKSFGAEVTGVCSTSNVDMVRSIGADDVIDYTKEDFTQREQRYDLIFDAVAKSSFSDSRPALKPSARYVTTAYGPGLVLKAKMVRGDKKMIPMLSSPTKRDLVFLRDLLESGKLTPVIDRRYSLSEVPEAIRYLEEGHAKGKVIITVRE